MVSKLRHLLLCVVVMVGLAACGGGSPTPTPTAPQTTTLLVYMVGSDLESGPEPLKGNATINIQEMLQATTSDKVNVVLTTGGALKDDPANLGLVKSWKTLKRHVVKNGKIEELADLGRVNMADPATLTEFIKWAKTAYPADRYMLMFWNHGAGYNGFGGDENFPRPWRGDTRYMVPASFTLPDIVTALKNAKDATGITFDFIAYDACLMATVEVADAMAPYARYLGASQELEPGTGWDWTVALNTLAANPGIDAPSFGRALADGFIAKQEREAEKVRREYEAAYLEDKYNTFSIVDLSRIPQVLAALDRFANAMLRSNQLLSSTGWLKVAEARAGAMSFGGSATKDQDAYDLADLYVLAQRLQAANIVPAESAALREAARNAVVYRKNGELVADTANGLSVYFPSRSVTNGASDTLTRVYENLTLPTSYKSMLKTYVLTAVTTPHFVTIDPLSMAGGVLRTNVASTLGIKTAVVTLSAQNDGGELGKIRIDGVMRAEMGDYGAVSANLVGGWQTLNGRLFAIVSMEPELNEAGQVIAFRHVIPILRNGIPTSLEVRETQQAMVVIGSWEGIGEDKMTSRSGDPILPDDEITLLSVKLDITGKTAEITNNPMSPPFKAGVMKFARTSLAPGNYNLRFVVTDYAEKDEFSAPFLYTP